MMNAAHAYARTSQAGLSPREAEAAVLVKAASRLQACRDADLTGSATLHEALTFNQRVWTVLAAAIADPANQLPDDIRQNVTQIAMFVFRTIVDAMIDPTATKLDALVSLNLQLAAGLQGKADTGGA